jgi:hypothetical protein
MNNTNNEGSVKKPIEREFEEVQGGAYDNFGFYTTPNGSFWDPDGIYFNRDGFDKHGGYYDPNMEYHPGKGWIEELLCYEDEKDEVIKHMPGAGQPRPRGRVQGGEEDFLGEGDDGDDLLDDLYDEVDFDKIIRNDEQYEHTEPQPHQVYRPKGNTNLNTVEKRPENDKITNTNQTSTTADVITPEMLFNKIPDNKKPIQVNNDNTSNMTNIPGATNKSDDPVSVRKENKVELDSLFK